MPHIYILALFLIVVTLLSNSLIVVAVWKKRSLRSTTNLLLLNLAISDIISFLFLPLQLVQQYVQLDEGPLADFLCKFFISWHVSVTASYASIFTLLVLAVERYNAIVKPMRSTKRLGDDTIGYAILCVWIAAFALSSPFYILGCYDKKAGCNFEKTFVSDSSFKLYFVGACGVFIIVGPFIVISYCYVQIAREFCKSNNVSPQNIIAAHETSQKRKLVKIALLVTVVYMLCFFPAIITYILTRRGLPSSYFKAAMGLYFMGPVFNPLLYSFQSSNFRQAFKEILKCKSVPVGVQ